MQELKLAGRIERFHGFDIIRLFSFIAILFFHWSYLLWAPRGMDYVPVHCGACRLVENYARLLSFSGFSVIFLSFFLMGLHGGSRKQKIYPALLLLFFLGWVASDNEFPYIWDIYPFLIVTIIAAMLLLRSKVPPIFSLIVFGALTSIPLWRLESCFDLPLVAKQILIGACSGETDLADWPLLPWAAYPLTAIAAGQLARKTGLQRLQSMSKTEAVAWFALFCAALPQLGVYFATPIGPRFSCFAFRQPPLVFWSHQLGVFFLMRLSFLAGVQTSLATIKVARAVSGLAMNRSFFLAYFIHFPIALAMIALVERYSSFVRDWVFYGGAVLLVVATEAATRGLTALWSLGQRRFSSRKNRSAPAGQ